MAFTSIVITATYLDQAGAADSGIVSFQLSTALKDTSTNRIVAPVLVTETLDANGAISTTLVATDDATTEPTGATYIVTERITGAGYGRTLSSEGMVYRRYQVEIPADSAGATVDLADLSPVEDADITYGLTRSDYDLQGLIWFGEAEVQANALPPGVEIPFDTTLTTLKVRVGTAPTGSGLTVDFNLDGVSIGTVTVADGDTEAEEAISAAATADQVLSWDIDAIGSTTPGEDVAIRVIGR